jgi:SAM-dependent methyltransferase
VSEQPKLVSHRSECDVNADQIQHDFDRIAALPEPAWNHNSHFHPLLLSKLPKSMPRLLDLGCGTGSFARLVAPRCGQVVGIDLSPRMIEQARNRSRDYSNIRWETADFLTGHWEDQSFDAIVSVAAVHHLSIDAFSRQSRKLLKPGGRLVVLDLRRDESIMDLVLTASSMAMSSFHRICRGQRMRPSAEARSAWDAHAQHDHYLSYHEACATFAQLLPGSVVRRHLYWRYSLDWTASCCRAE